MLILIFCPVARSGFGAAPLQQSSVARTQGIRTVSMSLRVHDVTCRIAPV